MLTRPSECPRLPRRRGRIRGQGLVEFALVLPVLLLLMMVALDFGRVYLGWVNLQNMARIAANYAANNASGFETNDAATLALYQQTIRNDAIANNCRMPLVAGKENAPAPVFSGYDVGDTATVSLTCSFGIITPIISNVLGTSVDVSASSQFPVKTGIIAASNTGGGGGGGIPVTAAFSCTPTSGHVTLVVQCNDESGGNPTTWSWTVTGPGGSTQTSAIRDPQFVLTVAGSYSVELVADNALLQPSTATRLNYITATPAADVDFTADPYFGPAPLTVNFFDASANSPLTWAWDFDNNGSVDSTIQNPTYTYNAIGSYDVKLTVTTIAGTFSKTATAFINVGIPFCNVPSFSNGVRRFTAPGIWTTAGFIDANLTDAPGAPNGNYKITYQSITPGTLVPCTTAMEVNG
jgi:PKD repeat protein